MGRPRPSDAGGRLYRLPEEVSKVVKIANYYKLPLTTWGALWRQITADVLGLPLLTTENSDSSLGSAMLAGLAAGVFRNPTEAAARCVRVSGEIRPVAANIEIYRRLFDEYRCIHDALAPIYRERGR